MGDAVGSTVVFVFGTFLGFHVVGGSAAIISGAKLLIGSLEGVDNGDMWGRPVQALYEDGGQWDEAVHPDDRLRIREAWTRMIDQENSYEEEVGNSLSEWASHSCCWQGALTQAYSKSSEEAQHSQRREGPANLMRNF